MLIAAGLWGTEALSDSLYFQLIRKSMLEAPCRSPVPNSLSVWLDLLYIDYCGQHVDAGSLSKLLIHWEKKTDTYRVRQQNPDAI